VHANAFGPVISSCRSTLNLLGGLGLGSAGGSGGGRALLEVERSFDDGLGDVGQALVVAPGVAAQPGELGGEVPRPRSSAPSGSAPAP
jgi:hypothetical protein